MKHKGTLEIRTARLLLRRFEKTDADAVFRNWANDPEVTRFLTWEPHTDASVTKKIIKGWVKKYRNPDEYHWIVECAGEVVGSVGVVRADFQWESCEVGYCFSKKVWGTGIATEALSAVIAFLFDTVGVHRIAAKYHIDNPASGRVMQKCGMEYEGTEREAVKRKDGSFADLRCFSIINGSVSRQTETAP